jgi:hypothetical protein
MSSWACYVDLSQILGRSGGNWGDTPHPRPAALCVQEFGTHPCYVERQAENRARTPLPSGGIKKDLPQSAGQGDTS